MKRLFSLCFGEKADDDEQDLTEPLISETEEEVSEDVFFDDDEIDLFALCAVTVCAGIMICQKEGQDERVVQLELAHKQLKESQEHRVHELASIKQELTAAVTTNNIVLNYVVSKVEEEQGMEAGNRSLKERTSRVERALALSAHKESHARFGLQKKRAPHSPLRGWSNSKYRCGSTRYTDHEEVPMKGVPKFQQVPINDGAEHSVQAVSLPFYSMPRLGPVGVRPAHVPRTSVAVVGDDNYALRLMLQHPLWVETSEGRNYEALKAKAFLEVLGSAGGAKGMWMPSSRLLVETNCDLSRLLVNAKNHGYMVWDMNGVVLTVDDVGDDDESSDADVASYLGAGYSYPYQILAVKDDFKSVAKKLRDSSYPASNVIPIAPYKYSIMFREPAPSAQEMQDVCRSFGWKLMGPAINGDVY